MRNYSGGGVGGSSTPDFHGFVQKDAVRGGQRYYSSSAIISEWLTAGWFVQSPTEIYAVPLLSTRGSAVTSLNSRAATIWGAVNKKARMGIYTATNQTSNLYPKNLVIDAGEQLMTDAALMTWPVAVTLDPGVLYWLVMTAESGMGIYSLKPNCAWAINGTWAAERTNASSGAWYATLPAYGALPATFPTVSAAAQEGGPPFYTVTFG